MVADDGRGGVPGDPTMAAPDYNVPLSDDRTTITCLHCARTQEVGRRAMSITCKFCHRSLRLDDIPFRGYEARRVVETCGIVMIEKKGNLVSDKVTCGGLIVRGKFKGNVVSRGPVLVGPDAEIRGDVTAPTLAVGAGAMLDGRYEIGPGSDTDLTSARHEANRSAKGLPKK